MKQDIEELIADCDGILSDITPAYNTIDPDLGDIEYYIQLDSVTAQLYKDYREARARYSQLDDGNSRNEAMQDVARDMMDSAWSALQTRLIEMRDSDERAAAMKAMRNLRHSDETRLYQQRERDYQRQAGFRRQRETAEAKKQQSREEAANSLLAYVFLFWFQLRWAVPKAVQQPQPRRAFSQVA